MAVLNLQTGRSKAVQVYGLKELQQNIASIMSAVVSKEAVAVSATAGVTVLSAMQSSARSAKVPSRVMDDFFMYARQPSSPGQSRGDSVNVLVGLKKKGTRTPARGYVTWHAGRQVGAFAKQPRLRKKGGTLKIGGELIGENLGTMWELGTTKMAARPWFRRAIQGARSAVFQIMADGYRAIIAKHAQ
jgi:hypothetical protein